MSDRLDLDHFLAIPRLSGLCFSPAADRLVVNVASPGPDGRKMRSAIWEVRSDGHVAPEASGPLLPA